MQNQAKCTPSDGRAPDRSCCLHTLLFIRLVLQVWRVSVTPGVPRGHPSAGPARAVRRISALPAESSIRSRHGAYSISPEKPDNVTLSQTCQVLCDKSCKSRGWGGRGGVEPYSAPSESERNRRTKEESKGNALHSYLEFLTPHFSALPCSAHWTYLSSGYELWLRNRHNGSIDNSALGNKY